MSKQRRVRRTPIVLLALVPGIFALALAARAADSAATVVQPPDPQALVQAIRANRKALVAVNLGLSAEEGAKFWPVYDSYQKEIGATGDRLAAVIQEYAAGFTTMSNEKALELVQAYLAAEADRLKIRQAYVEQFAKVVPGRTVARFYQIENKMDAVLRYDLAATIPVIDEKAAAPAK